MADFDFTEIFPLGPDTTTYRYLGNEGVSTFDSPAGTFLRVEPSAITLLTSTAMRDIAHLLRASHLQQLANILDDPEASDNDRFVALDLLKNASISAGGILPMCQDTGTAIVKGKKGQFVFTGGGDEEAIARGIYNTYLTSNLRYSQMAPLNMYDEVNTGNNLPAEIKISAVDGDAYKFLFMAKGGGSANKSYLFQETKALLNEKALLPWLFDKMKTLGIFGYNHKNDPNSNLAKQVSQMLWYYIDGIHVGRTEASLNEKEMFIECHIAFGAVETTFIKSMKTGRWWMKMPDGQYVPCSYNDFNMAGENEIPERWLRLQERN